MSSFSQRRNSVVGALHDGPTISRGNRYESNNSSCVLHIISKNKTNIKTLLHMIR